MRLVGWHHRLNGHEFEQTWGDREVQESLVWCSPWGSHKESDTTERMNKKISMTAVNNTDQTLTEGQCYRLRETLD